MSAEWRCGTGGAASVWAATNARHGTNARWKRMPLRPAPSGTWRHRQGATSPSAEALPVEMRQQVLDGNGGLMARI
jgi:hypothetical protein